MKYWVLQFFNAIAFSSLLFLVASGFSLIFGTMRVFNLAHTSLFLLGGYLGLVATWQGVPFSLAVVFSALGVGVVGFALERLFLRRLSDQPLPQVLVTLGVALVIGDLCLWIWGGDPFPLAPPAALAGVTRIGGVVLPKYRFAIIAAAILVGLALWLMLEKTRIGASVRAAVDDVQMARAVGIPAPLLFSIIFVIGSMLAGAAGVLAGPVLSIYPGLDFELLPLALVVVILGGIGSFVGSIVGSLFVGLIYVFGIALVPDLAYVILFLPMVVMLAVRPQGLFGRSAL